MIKADKCKPISPEKNDGKNKQWRRVVLGLGGNIGDVVSHMYHALEILVASDAVKLVDSSSIFETPPWGIMDQAVFLNCGVIISTHLAPLELLELCHKAEHALKRKRDIRWGPRTIDIDILLDENGAFTSKKLTIPHPRLVERGFVLVPLAQIAGDWMVQDKTIAIWRAQCDDTGIKRVGEGNAFDDLVNLPLPKC